MDEKIKILLDADGVKVIGNRGGLTGLAEIASNWRNSRRTWRSQGDSVITITMPNG